MRRRPPAVLRVAGVVAVEPYHPAFKLDPSIGRMPLADRTKANAAVYTLDVEMFPGENVKVLAESIRAIGGELKQVFSNRIEVELHHSRLTDLARIDSVRAVFEHIDYLPMAQESTNSIQAGSINFNSNPYHDAGIRGEGQILMVLDNGIQYFRPDLPYPFFLEYGFNDPSLILELKYNEELDNDAEAISNRFPFRMTKSSKYVTGLIKLFAME